jgi:hypothetical protein
MKFAYLMAIGLLIGCKTNSGTTGSEGKEVGFRPDFSPGPVALVYKTKADYADKVPVILSEDKSTIISYPHPEDLGKEAMPLHLKKGYLLDNRGINKNVAFLKLSYKEYRKLSGPPSLTQLQDMILDKDPLSELCNCGNRSAFKDAKGQINQLIQDGNLRSVCKAEK